MKPAASLLALSSLFFGCTPPPGGWPAPNPNFDAFMGRGRGGAGGSANPGEPGIATQEPATGVGEPATTEPKKTSTSTTSARCCVGSSQSQSAYACPSADAAARCLGQPFELIPCLDGCGSKGQSCTAACIETHGPQPKKAGCTRDPSQDSACR